MNDRELDALVAEKVMGLDRKFQAIVSSDGGLSACACVERDGPWYTEAQLRQWLDTEHDAGRCSGYSIDHWPDDAPYSTSISDAWLVVEEMRRLGFEFDCYVSAQPDSVFEARFERSAPSAVNSLGGGPFTESAVSLADAIARDALRALNAEVPCE